MPTSILIEALEAFDRLPGRGSARSNPVRKQTAAYLAFVQGNGINLQDFGERDWSDVADAMGLSDEARLDFLEEVAGWL